MKAIFFITGTFSNSTALKNAAEKDEALLSRMQKKF